MTQQAAEVAKRRTFAIISHPDAGKTTITEKLLLMGKAIAVAGTVKSRKSDRHATSDWMEMEKQRGISITTSVMQFPYRDHMVNLLDTPGHEDFSEDTYRTLTAVDSALMVLDGGKGVEPRTIALMDVCRLRDTPIVSFINKLDRDIRDPIELLDEIEAVLKIKAAPITWPIGCYRDFKGVYHLADDYIIVYTAGHGHERTDVKIIEKLDSDEARAHLGDEYDRFVDQLELVQGACHEFNQQEFLDGQLTPVFFGTALGNFGVDHVLDAVVDWAPKPLARVANERTVEPVEEKFTGFVFKIQANMDPKHRDRIAFMRICSGKYEKGMKMRHVRTGKDVRIGDALTFFSSEREQLEEAFAGDIIGLKATVFDGSYHDVDSNEMAFKVAASMATKQLAQKGGGELLEPIMAVEVVTPEDYMGDVMGDLNRRRGMIQGMEDTVSGKVIRAEVPLGEMFGYATDVRSMSQGRASYSMEFKKYNTAPSHIVETVTKKQG